jgi:hypothetical protein
MSYLCGTIPAELPDLAALNCERLGQIQKIIFQRIYSTGTTKNSLTIATTDPNLLATWTTLLTASDGTKAVITPTLNAAQIEAGEAIEVGGSPLNIPSVVGAQPSVYDSHIPNARQDLIEDLKAYAKEANVGGAGALGVYFVNTNGKIFGIADDVETATTFQPIRVYSLFVGDKTTGNIEDNDKNTVKFYLPQNWSDKLYMVTPSDFDANSDLINS